MYKAAVCSSDALFISDIKKIIKQCNVCNQCNDCNQYSLEIHEFYAEKDLASSIDNEEQFDLLILDARYLLKTYPDKQITGGIKEILEAAEIKSGQRYIVGHYRNVVIKVDVKNILYIENAKRGSKVVIHPDYVEAGFDKKLLVDYKLEILAEKFSEFVFANRSYIVNILHIQKIVGNELYLDDGECLTVSRAYRKSIRESFLKSGM